MGGSREVGLILGDPLGTCVKQRCQYHSMMRVLAILFFFSRWQFFVSRSATLAIWEESDHHNAHPLHILRFSLLFHFLSTLYFIMNSKEFNTKQTNWSQTSFGVTGFFPERSLVTLELVQHGHTWSPICDLSILWCHIPFGSAEALSFKKNSLSPNCGERTINHISWLEDFFL